MGASMRIYFAAPLFTQAERVWNSAMARMLRTHGWDVFLPQDNEPRELTARNIFLADVAGIDSSDLVVAVMDGPDPDSGTCWEVGYAYGHGKPVIELRTDFRVSGESTLAPFNLMLSESANQIVQVNSITDTFEGTVARLAAAISSMASQLVNASNS